jgi:hypothetical protein
MASHLSICTHSFWAEFCICGNRVKPYTYVIGVCILSTHFYKHFLRGSRQVNDLLALFFMLSMSILIQFDVSCCIKIKLM